MRKVELLAPAKDIECGKAAIDHGADAVYIGAERFGARAAAGNSLQDIRCLCKYAHRFLCKVYVTLNTLVHDDERDELRRIVTGLAEVGVDAVLIQDPGIIDIIKAHPQLAIHASTQADNRTADKIHRLRDMGFRRAVLARELSVGEIAAIHRAEPTFELEAFVHGALCVSYSGLCYASEYCFNRSANRGECAQFCRLKFDLVDSKNTVIERGRHLLSLRDMSRYDHLEALLDAGVTSFKIEGRLKDITYVKNVTAAYSERLNAIIERRKGEYSRSSIGKSRYTFTPDIEKTFNRGYTDYFLYGRTADITSFDTPKAIGKRVGRVKDIKQTTLTVAGTAAFANGDGLCFIDDKHRLTGFRVNKAEGNRLTPLSMPQGLRKGMVLYRNNDQEFERTLSHTSGVRKISVTMTLCETANGYSLRIEVGNGLSSKANISIQKQQAISPQEENIARQLTKLGNTCYECTDLQIADGCRGCFIPSSALTELRRSAIEKLDLAIAEAASCKSSHSDLKPQTSADTTSRQETWPTHTGNIPLMQCRHCLRFSLGHCTQHGGRKAPWHEPLYLVMADGRCFPLQFDCKNCQMNILKPIHTNHYHND